MAAAAAATVVAITVLGGGRAGPAVDAAAGVDAQNGNRRVTGEDGSLLLVSDSDPGTGMQALGGGTLTRTPEGCLGWDMGNGSFQLVLWPSGTTWDPTSETLSVPARGDFRLGEEIRLGGGESDVGAAGMQLPASCLQEKTWIGFDNRPFHGE